MAYPPGSVRLSAPVGVGSDQDNFGTHYDILGVGGYRSVADNDALQGIPALRRKKGMLVYKQDNNTIYKYMSADGSKVDDIGNSSATSGWVPLSFSGGSSLPGNTGLATGTVYFLKNSFSSSTWSQTWAELAITDISGTLPINKGGTNSNTGLTNNKIMISSAGAIVEATAITGNQVLVSNNNGIPIHSGVASSALNKLANVPDNTNTDIGNKLNITAATANGGSSTLTLDFSATATDTIYGNTTTAHSGGISATLSSPRIGVTHIVVHNASSLTLGSPFKKLSGSGNYVSGVNNIIFFTCIDQNTVIYSINQI